MPGAFTAEPITDATTQLGRHGSAAGKKSLTTAKTLDDRLLGHVDWDRPAATNERVFLRAPGTSRQRVLRNQFVRVVDFDGGPALFLGRIVAGPFFPGSGAADGTA